MIQDAVEMQVVRESLETVLSPEIAAAVLLEALEETGGELPDGSAKIRSFVAGPIAIAVTRRVGEHAAELVTGRIEAVLGPAPGAEEPVATGPAPAGSPETAPSRPSVLPTAEIRRPDGPARVVVAASGPGLASRLRTALGPHRLAVTAAATPRTTRQLVDDFSPHVVLIDGDNPPKGQASDMCQALAGVSAEVMVILWARPGAYCDALARELTTVLSRVVVLDRAQGADPLLDLLRMRGS